MIASATPIETTARTSSDARLARAVERRRPTARRPASRGGRRPRPPAGRGRRSRPPRSRRPARPGRRRRAGSGSWPISVARLTVAASTPGVLRRKRSIRLTHDAQVMPSIGRRTSVVGRSPVRCRHTPREYTIAARRAAGQGDTATMAAAVVERTLAGPWGPFHLAATARGVVAVELARDRRRVRAALVRRLRVHGRVAARPGGRDDRRSRRRHLDAAIAALEALLDGPAGDAGPCPIDLADRPALGPARARRRARRSRGARPRATARSPAGSARRGRPRAVGGAVGRNPICLLIPCHRVIAADGTHRRLRRRRLGHARGPPRAQARAAPARRRHGRATRAGRLRRDARADRDRHPGGLR